MKQAFFILLAIAALASCKKEEDKQVQLPAPTQIVKIPSIEELAAKSLASKDDWTKDLGIYIDDVMSCVKIAPGQVKYVFRADAFENPPVEIVLLKTEADKVYGCSFTGTGDKPIIKEIRIDAPKNTARFYPGRLPKADSCLENTRVLDNSGRVAGWVAKISC